MCCSSDRDVPVTQMDYFLTNCRNTDRMSSNGSARLAEISESRDVCPSLNLGRVKQGCAIRTGGLDLRVARLRHESEMTVELMTDGEASFMLLTDSAAAVRFATAPRCFLDEFSASLRDAYYLGPGLLWCSSSLVSL